MPNSDNAHGVHNKETVIYTKPDGDNTTFADVAAAQSYFLSTAALTVYDECATQIQWALVSNTGLKVTYAFGTKGTDTAEADDWTAQFHARKKALSEEIKGPFNISAIAFDHTEAGDDKMTVTAAGHTFVAGETVVFDSVGGFTGTSEEGNINEDPGIKVASVSGNDFVTGATDNETMSYTSGGTVQALYHSWNNVGGSWATSDSHLF